MMSRHKSAANSIRTGQERSSRVGRQEDAVMGTSVIAAPCRSAAHPPPLALASGGEGRRAPLREPGWGAVQKTRSEYVERKNPHPRPLPTLARARGGGERPPANRWPRGSRCPRSPLRAAGR